MWHIPHPQPALLCRRARERGRSSPMNAMNAEDTCVVFTTLAIGADRKLPRSIFPIRVRINQRTVFDCGESSRFATAGD